jgi:hypothetical protein
LNHFLHIQEKLEQFIRKFYTNELIKGIILFFAIGLLYFIATVLIEHFLWLSQTGRTILFWLFILVEVALFARFIAFPLAKLFKLKEGIDFSQASKIIGNHFPEVNDKLLNVLQLKENKQQSELLLASIEQKSRELQPIPFVNAVDFKHNLRYLKYAAIPVIIILLLVLTGNINVISGSYERVVNYKIAYEPPAPFSFFVVNEKLEALENKPFVLNVKVAGDVIPETASITFNNETYFLQQTAKGEFQYTFTRPVEDINFRLQANEVTSRPYTIEVIKVPTLLSFEMELQYPRYTQKASETLKSTGNATVPEGTTINWKLNTRETKNVKLKTNEAIFDFTKESPHFVYSKPVFSKLDYTISTSNDLLNDYENLNFSINVVRDQHPEIVVDARQDTLNSQITYFFGRVSDDYGLTRLQLVYYPSDDEKKKTIEPLQVNRGTFDQFLYVFPGELELEPGKTYSYYFEVFDNDGINGAKSSKSTVFSFRKLTREELERQQLEEQREAIQGLNSTLQNMEQQKKSLEELSRMQKEKSELNWNDKQKVEEFLKRQKLQEEMMKKFSEKAKENLENFQKENETDPQKEELLNRFEENQERSKENEDLLEELQKLKDKIEEEELFNKLEQLSQQNKKQQRNLEQLLELTKRYYVEKKAQKLAEELEKLADKQEALSKSPEEENTKEKQEELNKAFEEHMEEMEQLREDNQDLKSPMDLPDNSAQEQEVQQDQQDATDQLDQQQQEGAKEKQKSAADKMREMSQQMQMQMSASASQGAQEDMEMLRQVLDNLVIYSHSQEGLMEDFRDARYGNPLFGRKLVRQSELKQNFQHVDDSLFALALRNPMIGTVINDLIEEVHYNMDKSMEELAQNRVRNGVASQQYSVTGANDLAVLLSNALNNMQMQMSGAAGQGQGEGRGFQLPDIIKQQESLIEKMEQGTNPGEEGDDGEEQGEGEGQGDGEGEGDGQTGSDGDGNDGKSGDGDKQGDGEGGKLESEEMKGLLFEIYKQQQMLRMQLEDRMRQEGLPADARNLMRQMEQVEQELLERGFNQATLRKMNEIKHQLMKLEQAAFQQGEDERRQGRTNREEYQNTLNRQLENARNYFNNIEILNRQQLPFRQTYKQKVQDYFNTPND